MICQACGSETDSVSGIWVCRNCDYNGLVAKEYRAEEWRERRSTA